MAKPYEEGRIVGSYEVIRYLGRRVGYNGAYESVYRVRCTSCHKVQDMTSYEMRRPSSCVCMQSTPVRSTERKRSRVQPNADDNADRLWMSPGEIWRHYNELADKSNGVAILAELNDVSEREIRKILREESNKRKDKLWQTSNG